MRDSQEAVETLEAPADSAADQLASEPALAWTEAAVLRLQVVASGVYPPDFGGGQLRVHKTLLRLGQRHPLAAEVLAFAGRQTSPGLDEIDGIPVWRLSGRRSLLNLFTAVGRRLWQRKAGEPAVVYVIATGRLAYVAAFWAKLLRLKLVVEIINCTLRETLPRRLAGWLFTRSADLVVAISEPVARDVRTFNVDAARLWVRPNPVDIARHRLPTPAERDRQRLRLGYGPSEVVHLLAGSIAPRKNQLFAVEAFERLDVTHRLLIVGPVLPHNQAYAARLRQRIDASPAQDRITLVEEFSDTLHETMFAADCLWMPSLEEGLGNVMLEALCCGVPCVINRGLGMDEHLLDGENGHQAPLDAEAWCEAVLATLPIAQNFERRRAISDAARARYDAKAFDAEFHRRILALADLAPARR